MHRAPTATPIRPPSQPSHHTLCNRVPRAGWTPWTTRGGPPPHLSLAPPCRARPQSAGRARAESPPRLRVHRLRGQWPPPVLHSRRARVLTRVPYIGFPSPGGHGRQDGSPPRSVGKGPTGYGGGQPKRGATRFLRRRPPDRGQFRPEASPAAQQPHPRRASGPPPPGTQREPARVTQSLQSRRSSPGIRGSPRSGPSNKLSISSNHPSGPTASSITLPLRYRICPPDPLFLPGPFPAGQWFSRLLLCLQRRSHSFSLPRLPSPDPRVRGRCRVPQLSPQRGQAV